MGPAYHKGVPCLLGFPENPTDLLFRFEDGDVYFFVDILLYDYTGFAKKRSEVGKKTSLTHRTIGSMYGIFPYIYQKFMPNEGKYPINGSYG